MKSWNKGSYDITLKNGEVIEEYFIEYRTWNKKELLLLEKICEDLVDNKFKEILVEDKNESNSINYYVIENTVNEYDSRITGKYATIDEARNDMKNHYDWYMSEPCGNIFYIKEWFDGFNHKVEKTFIERHFGNEIIYKEY